MKSEGQMDAQGLECPVEGLAAVTGDKREPQTSMGRWRAVGSVWTWLRITSGGAATPPVLGHKGLPGVRLQAPWVAGRAPPSWPLGSHPRPQEWRCLLALCPWLVASLWPRSGSPDHCPGSNPPVYIPQSSEPDVRE